MLTLFSYFIIPTLTLYFARGTDWFTTNFSSIIFSLSRQQEFLLWSLITGGYFYFTIRQLLKRRIYLHNIKMESFLFWACACMMVLFVFTPYLPAYLPSLSFIHVVSALLCSLLFFLCLMSLILKSYFKAPDIYRSCVISMIAVAVFCLSAFIMTGIINSAMEICYVITCSLLTKRLLKLSEGDALIHS